MPILQQLTSIPRRILHVPKNMWVFLHVWVWGILTFIFFLFLYLVYKTVHSAVERRFIPLRIQSILIAPFDRMYGVITRKSALEERTINRINLIDLAMRNMMFKKSRAFITIGGMAIGVGAIVFLVSIGYGLQQMVTSRVARLDELSQTDVVTLPGSRERITDVTLSRLKEIPHVHKTLPLISSVARVTVSSSITDMAVYAVTSDYLSESAIKPLYGKIFESNEISKLPDPGKVAGISTDDGIREMRVTLTIDEGAWIKVREKADRSGKVLGYTKNTGGSQKGALVWGGRYSESNGLSLKDPSGLKAPWIASSFPLWKKDPSGEYVQLTNKDEEQQSTFGYVAYLSLLAEEDTDPALAAGSVLGTTTDASSSASAILSSDGEWVEIASESATAATEKITKIDIPSNAKKQAVVNTAMLKLIGIDPTQAVGKTFSTSFVITSDLLEKNDQKLESTPTDYVISGVIKDDKTPYFYVPFVDLRSLGVRNYSQVKVVVDDKNALSASRKLIENLGFSSRSVADTVKQIDRLFATARTILGILGMVALGVAALGMFNTLTVSLLERTREVGLMKAMGMKSHEVQELFLTESMVMGFFGGILGVVFGYMTSKLVGLAISAFSIPKGYGYIDIAYLPFSFVGFIFLLSLLVGVLTGIYPARRATKISALDALRYE